MHLEWLDQVTVEEVAGAPELVMENYFLDASGRPDKTKTPSPIGIPLSRYSDYHEKQLLAAARGISGLRSATGSGVDTTTVYLGWDPAAVGEEARSHAAKEEKGPGQPEKPSERRSVQNGTRSTLQNLPASRALEH